jgi:hypothetical protein
MDGNHSIGSFVGHSVLIVAFGVAVLAMAGIVFDGARLLITVVGAEAGSFTSQGVTQAAQAAFAQATDTRPTNSQEHPADQHHIEHHPEHAKHHRREDRYACWCCRLVRPVWQIEYPRCRYGIGACGWGGHY